MSTLAQILQGVTTPSKPQGGMGSKGGMQRPQPQAQPPVVNRRPATIGTKGGAPRLPTETQFGGTPLVQHDKRLPPKDPTYGGGSSSFGKVPVTQNKPTIQALANPKATNESGVGWYAGQFDGGG